MTTSLRWISSLAVAAAMSLCSFSSGAQAPIETDGLSRAVKVWDLDLAKSADVEQLYERLQSTATAVCRAEVRRYRRDTRVFPPFGWEDSCVKRAVDDAVREAGHRRLAALHQATSRG